MVYLPSLHSMLKIRFQIGRSIQRLVTDNLASIYQQYMSDNAFYILYLMGGDDENTIIGKSLRNKLTKLALPRNVKTIGRLVHRSEEHTSELQSRQYLVCRLLLEKKT